MPRQPPDSTLFPYTTLFRSILDHVERGRRVERHAGLLAERADRLQRAMQMRAGLGIDRKSTRLNSSHGYISYAVFCLKKKKSRTLSPNRSASAQLEFVRVQI